MYIVILVHVGSVCDLHLYLFMCTYAGTGMCFCVAVCMYVCRSRGVSHVCLKKNTGSPRYNRYYVCILCMYIL